MQPTRRTARFSRSLSFVLSQPLHTGIAAAIVLSPSFAVCNVSLDHGEVQARVALEQCNGIFVVDESQTARAALLQSNGTVTETWFTHLPPTPRVGVVRAMTGCPSNAFPFTADCNLEGATTLQVEGLQLEAAVRMELVATSGSYPLLRSTCTCEASADLMTVICSRCSGYGGGLIAVLYDGSGGEVARSALPLVSFELGRDDLCPIGANGLLCSGHGMCDASRGLCLCEQHVSFGFWGEDCSSCTSMFNDSSLCSISCPLLVSMVRFVPEMGLARMGSADAAFRGLGPLAAIRVTVRMAPARVMALVTRQQALATAVRTTLVVAVRTADLG